VAHIDDDLIATTLADHHSGIAVLSAPPEFEQADAITADEFRQVLDALRQHYQYVVVDCAPTVDRITLATMDAADLLLLVTTPELAALKNASRLIQLGVRLGYPENKLRLVVNRNNMPGAISASDFEQHLDYRASFHLPQDSTVVSSLTRGEPLVTAARSSPAGRAFTNLARAVSNNHGWLGERAARKAPIARILAWRSARPAEAA
jgi:pilus assembly protein CpaE